MGVPAHVYHGRLARAGRAKMALRHRAGSPLAPRARRGSGDGKVAIEDLKVLMAYFEKANPPVQP